MMPIQKNAEPRELLDWKIANKDYPGNLVYRGGGFPYEAVVRALWTEQFHLCAYTLRRMKMPTDCHIEHFLPQSRNIPAETIDYRNMLACYPAPNQKACPFGAQFKADKDPSIVGMCSPLHPATAYKFTFNTNGEVHAQAPDAEVAVEILNLNHPILVDDRRSVIGGMLATFNKRQISAKDARRRAEALMKPDADGALQSYYIAQVQAALRYAGRAEARSDRIRKGQ